MLVADRILLPGADHTVQSGDLKKNPSSFLVRETKLTNKKRQEIRYTQYLNCKMMHGGDAFAVLTNFTQSFVEMIYFSRRN